MSKRLWQFTVKLFGLCKAPAIFERLMEKVLQQLINKICLVYLDDVVIFNEDFEGMMKRLEQIFYRLRSANLKLNPKKCSFLKKEILLLLLACWFPTNVKVPCFISRQLPNSKWPGVQS